MTIKKIVQYVGKAVLGCAIATALAVPGLGAHPALAWSAGQPIQVNAWGGLATGMAFWVTGYNQRYHLVTYSGFFWGLPEAKIDGWWWTSYTSDGRYLGPVCVTIIHTTCKNVPYSQPGILYYVINAQI